MNFSNVLFIYAFLPLFTVIYYIVPKKHRITALFAISLLYSFTSGLFAVILLFLFSLIIYGLCRLIKAVEKHRILSFTVLIFTIAISLFFVAVCRYNILLDNIIGGRFTAQLVLIGSSLCAISAIGAVIDVYSGVESSINSYFKFGLYIIYFPKNAMGPYVSYHKFLKMLENPEKGTPVLGEGMCLFVKGLTKKVIVSDGIYQLWSAVEQLDVSEISALTAWLGVLSYALSLYYLLSGVTDMASGMSLLFGIRLPRSFNYPCCTIGINEFCMRWQTNISGWFRKYVYRPATLRCKNKLYKCMIYILVWCLFGVWYEATPNKIIWGFIIGFSAVLERTFNKNYSKQIFSIIYTLLITLFGWVFFMSDNTMYALRYIKAMVGGNNIIADSVGFYLLTSYIVLILVGFYAATDLFKNLIERTRGNKNAEVIVNVISVPISLLLLICCTAIIIGSNNSSTLLLSF